MNRIFKWLCEESNEYSSVAYIKWFASNFDPSEFMGNERLMLCFIKYCGFLGITPKRAYLDAYIKVDLKSDIKKYNIKIDTLGAYDYSQVSQLEEAYQILAATAVDTFELYMQEDLSGRDFKVDLYDFIKTRKSDKIQEAFMKFYPMLTDGSDPNEVSTKMRTILTNIDKVYDVKKAKEVDFMHATKDVDDSSDDMEFVCYTGIPCIDGDIGGIYTKLMYTLTAQPGGGKTRMSIADWAYPVLMAGYDVYYLETEMSRNQIENALIAHHIVQIYGGRIKIPDSVMNKKKEMSPEQRQIYESAKIDLFESGKYGKFIFKLGVVAEQVEEDVLGVIREDPNIRLVVLDYMGHCKSDPGEFYRGKKDRYEIITDAYEGMRSALLQANFAALCLNQYNDKGIAKAEMGKHMSSGDVQGGHVVERETDYDMHLTYTEEQRIAGVRSFNTAKVRGASGFNDVLIGVDLSVSIFNQQSS